MKLFLRTANEGLIRKECSAANTGDICGENLCCCRAALIADLLEHFWSTQMDPSNADPYTDSYLHTKWNRTENCPSKASEIDMVPTVQPSGKSACEDREHSGYMNQPELRCCGLYPRRKPIRTSTRECCSFEKTYSVLSEQCCEETEKVIPIGEMC